MTTGVRVPPAPGLDRPSPFRGDGPGVKSFRAGTHRTVPPRTTLADLAAKAAAMGITRVATVTGLDRIGIPVAVACRPNSRSLAVSQGKGLDLPAAKASALMESVEAYHAERITLPLRWGSVHDLAELLPLADVAGLPRLASSAFDADTPILWIEGTNLVDGRPCWVPYECVHTRYTVPLPPGSGSFAATSNGLASGNHLLEAVSHGICEVVERDAATLWQALPAGSRDACRVDPGAVPYPSCQALLGAYRRAGIAVAIWEITTDVGIPAFLAAILDEQRSPMYPTYPTVGAGAHPTAEVALSRALTEAAQVRLTFITGSRDDMVRADYESFAGADTVRSFEALVTAAGPMRPIAEGGWEAPTLGEDVELEIARLAAVGIAEVVAVDLSIAGLGIPVVRIVIPGLEGPAGIYRGRPGNEYVPGRRLSALLDRPAP